MIILTQSPIQEDVSQFNATLAVAVLVSNDVKYMHFLASGEDFDKCHNMTDEYYKHLSDDVDYLAELSVEKGCSPFNFSCVGGLASGYDIEGLPSYNYIDTVNALRNKLSVYIASLEELRNATADCDIQSKLDDMIRFWSKEVNYKLARRL